jgi:acid stress-induced BolA-like protein IbaG/YrbA
VVVLQVTFVKDEFEDSQEFRQVQLVRDSLLDYLNQPEAIAAIKNVNQPGKSSSEIQASFLEHA